MIRVAMTGERGTFHYKLFKEWMDTDADAVQPLAYQGPIPGDKKEKVIERWVALYEDDLARASRNPGVVRTVMTVR
jgi:hypothetical protein